MTISYLNPLPPELWTNILCHHDLPLLTFGNCQIVCQLFNQIVNGAEMIWKKWANVLDKDNQWKSVYIHKSLRDDFTWKWLVIDFKNTETQTLNVISNKDHYPFLKKTLEMTQYRELTPFLHSDNADILNLLGISFLFGKGCAKIPQKAIEYFTQAAHQKHASAQYNLGHCYKIGTGCIRDSAKTFHYYKLAANQGHKEAQNTLGDYYTAGICCKQNLVKAFYYYKLAADQGHKGAQNTVADCYITGRGGQVDANKAAYYHKLAANPDSLDDRVEEKNHKQINKIEKQTITWLSAKAKHPVLQKTLENTLYHELAPFLKSENPHLLTLLGEAFLYGSGCYENRQKCIKYFKEAADKNHAKAQYYLGNFYENGEDLNRAFLYYKLAAEQGDVNAQVKLGFCYEQGNGCQVDVDKAFQYYKGAAEQGNAAAQFQIGMWYEEGKGCQVDVDKAFQYYKGAAEQGNAAAQFQIGMWYEEGFLYQQNKAAALKYYKLAADQGHPEAIEKYDELTKRS